MKNTLNGADYKLMVTNAAAAVEKNKQALNELNVFPVPDGDTGTNMALTLCHAADDLASVDSKRICKVADKTSSSLLRGAHGNSGVITSLLFGGIAKSLKEKDEADAVAFAAALRVGVDRAYSAVNKPAEGTILTVARLAAAEAETSAKNGADIVALLSAVCDTAEEALAHTPEQNPVLAKAGVVDAGGKGLCIIYRAMLAAVKGETIGRESGAQGNASGGVFAEFETEDITFGYCTEFIVERENTLDPALLRSFLLTKGDCVVVVDDDEIIKVHVHTNNPGLAIEEALKYGGLTSIKIDNMRKQHSSKLEIESEAPAREKKPEGPAAPEKKYGFVAVASGEGVLGVFTDLGADALVEGGQTMNPSTQDILSAINSVPAEVVFVLPNNKNIILAAEQTVGLTEKKVIVIGTKSIPEGTSAMLAFDETASEEENREAMTAAAKNVRTSTVTYAARDSVFDGMDIKQGDYLALAGSKIGYTGSDFAEVCRELASRLELSSASFVTVFSGRDATPEQTVLLEQVFSSELSSDADIAVVEGGQPVYYYIIGVE